MMHNQDLSVAGACEERDRALLPSRPDAMSAPQPRLCLRRGAPREVVHVQGYVAHKKMPPPPRMTPGIVLL